MKITKVMLENMVRQELKKVLKEAQIPPHRRSLYDSEKLYLNSDLEPLYEGLFQDVSTSLNVFSILRKLRSSGLEITEESQMFAAKIRNTILRNVKRGIEEATLLPSEIITQAGEEAAEDAYPNEYTNQDDIYNEVLGRLNDITDKYMKLEAKFEKEEMEYDDEDDYHDELGPDATEDDFY